ncbi:MAG: hypothetical protein HC929_09130 [Leptolyngbyaceae cyanobacterium SM2_5_2]|nr:hypothetical protein [Leptolyngbyaceae cyanobacterium SM2_5_2]
MNIARPKTSIPIAIPRMFNIQAGNERLHVHPNATKHFREELNHFFFPSGGGLIQQQVLLSSFHGALKSALELPDLNRSGRNFVRQGDWELGIDFSNQGSGRLPVVFHARPISEGKIYPRG